MPADRQSFEERASERGGYVRLPEVCERDLASRGGLAMSIVRSSYADRFWVI